MPTKNSFFLNEFYWNLSVRLESLHDMNLLVKAGEKRLVKIEIAIHFTITADHRQFKLKRVHWPWIWFESTDSMIITIEMCTCRSKFYHVTSSFIMQIRIISQMKFNRCINAIKIAICGLHRWVFQPHNTIEMKLWWRDLNNLEHRNHFHRKATQSHTISWLNIKTKKRKRKTNSIFFAAFDPINLTIFHSLFVQKHKKQMLLRCRCKNKNFFHFFFVVLLSKMSARIGSNEFTSTRKSTP